MSENGRDYREVMSATEAARFLRRRTQDVLDDIASGRIPSVVIGTRRRVLRSTLLAWLHAQQDASRGHLLVRF